MFPLYNIFFFSPFLFYNVWGGNIGLVVMGRDTFQLGCEFDSNTLYNDANQRWLWRK